MKTARTSQQRPPQESEFLYRSVFENAAASIYLITPDGQCVFVNNAMADVLGYRSHEDLMAALNNRECKLFESSEGGVKSRRFTPGVDGTSTVESRVSKRDGSPIWISQILRPVYDTNENVLYYVGAIQDVTERRKIEDELRESEKHHRVLAELSDRRNDLLLDIIDEMDGVCADLDDLFVSFVRVITDSIDEKRLWRKGHSERVARYALGIAKGIGLREDELKCLHLAALLHDIGKLRIAGELIDKPSELTDTEFESLRRHPVHGAEMLAHIESLRDIVPLIRHHHEWYDGSGYPDRLRGEGIPLGARILHLADSFDSMTAQRPYRAANGREYAFREIRRGSNAQFDPQLANIALKVL